MVATYSMLYGQPPEEVPSVNFVRQCHLIIEEVGLMITAIKMGIADSWPYWGIAKAVMRVSVMRAQTSECDESTDANLHK
jgi:hypothetical protein